MTADRVIGAIGSSITAIERRARLIYDAARTQSDLRLWRAALGDDNGSTPGASGATAPAIRLDALIQLFGSRDAPAPGTRAVPPPMPTVPARSVGGLGANAVYSDTIDAAARRTGIPGPALVAIIDAESAKGRDGGWRTTARNPRSSATGIGQFLAGTWRSEAERAGTWLNRAARAQGWIGPDGTVRSAALGALFALREDGEASIHATADYARRSLDQLAKAGVAIGDSVAAITDTAYIGHNLGVADATRYFRGDLGEARAEHLLAAQVGPLRAAAKIADAGSAVAAHRRWLGDFMARHVRS